MYWLVIEQYAAMLHVLQAYLQLFLEGVVLSRRIEMKQQLMTPGLWPCVCVRWGKLVTVNLKSYKRKLKLIWTAPAYATPHQTSPRERGRGREKGELVTHLFRLRDVKEGRRYGGGEEIRRRGGDTKEGRDARRLISEQLMSSCVHHTHLLFSEVDVGQSEVDCVQVGGTSDSPLYLS